MQDGRDFMWGPSSHTPATLVVEYLDGQTRRYVADQGWRIERRNEVPCIILGDGAPGTYIPLDGVRSFDVVFDDGV